MPRDAYPETGGGYYPRMYPVPNDLSSLAIGFLQVYLDQTKHVLLVEVIGLEPMLLCPIFTSSWSRYCGAFGIRF